MQLRRVAQVTFCAIQGRRQSRPTRSSWTEFHSLERAVRKGDGQTNPALCVMEPNTVHLKANSTPVLIFFSGSHQELQIPLGTPSVLPLHSPGIPRPRPGLAQPGPVTLPSSQEASSPAWNRRAYPSHHACIVLLNHGFSPRSISSSEPARQAGLPNAKSAPGESTVLTWVLGFDSTTLLAEREIKKGSFAERLPKPVHSIHVCAETEFPGWDRRPPRARTLLAHRLPG